MVCSTVDMAQMPSKDRARRLPDVPVTFEQNKEYVRAILAAQVDLRTDGLGYVDVNDLPSDHRYFQYQAVANRNGTPWSRSSPTTAPRTSTSIATRPKAPIRSRSCKRRPPPIAAERSETMPVLTPTKADGATAKPNQVLYVDPACQVTDDMLAEQISVGGMNASVVADLLSGMLAHERCGVHPHRTVAARSNNPMLKRRYEEFGEETLHHVEVLEQLITTLGGNPNYVSPNAKPSAVWTAISSSPPSCSTARSTS